MNDDVLPKGFGDTAEEYRRERERKAERARQNCGRRYFDGDYKAADPIEVFDPGPTPDDHDAYNPMGEAAPQSNGRDQKPAPTFKKIINPADWEGVPVPERRYCVPGYFPHGQVCLLSGDGGQGKSLLALQLAVARQMGADWIGLMPEPGKTLLLSAEDDGEELHRRLDAVRSFYGASWAELAGIRLIDLVGEDSVLAALMKGRIEPTEMYRALDAYMADFKPSLTVLDVLADMFAGDESDRPQVRQFINLLKRLARKHDCTIILLAHPSLTGMNTGTGLSGSTDWNNGVRARAYLKTPKTADGDTPDKNLRAFEGMKANYGEVGGKINLRWQDGVFVPVTGPTGLDKLAQEQKADDVFLQLLKQFNEQGRNASEKTGTSYAPALFAQQPDADGFTKKQLEAAMNRLFREKKIRVEVTGPASRPSRTLVPADE
ncbi:MAG: AAA family ATPase [Methylocystis sp.]|uniref:AAA family ATPase n=1 Tax=Methylocystis sp. TaxID=1911079 RepID=UPI003DA657B9